MSSKGGVTNVFEFTSKRDPCKTTWHYWYSLYCTVRTGIYNLLILDSSTTALDIHLRTSVKLLICVCVTVLQSTSGVHGT